MSHLFKLFIMISSLYLISSEPLLNQSQYYNNSFLFDNPSIMASYLIKSMNFKNNLGFRKDFIEKFVQAFSEFWAKTHFIPLSYIFNKNFLNCLNSFTGIQSNNLTKFIGIIVESSGTFLNDLGNEYFCKSQDDFSDLEYYIFESYFEETTNITNDEDKSLLEFLNQNYFSLG